MSDITLTLTSPHMTGSIVTGCQQDMNTRLDAWDVPFHVVVDGDWGMESRDTARSLLYGLGVDVSDDAFDGVSSSDRTKIRHGWGELTTDEKTRFMDRASWRHRLALRYGGGSVEEALSFARANIGVTEHPANSNTGPTIDPWQAACGVHAAPWCGCFLNAVLVHGGFPNNPRLRFCPFIEADAKAGVGGWSWVPVGHDVQIGDCPLYGASIAEHVGIVEETTNGVDSSTIEGNTSNGPGGSQSNGGIVARRHRHADGSLSGFPIRGYARPNWK